MRVRTKPSESNPVTYIWLYVVSKNGIDEMLYPYENLSSQFTSDEQYRQDLKDHMVSKRGVYFQKRHPRMPLLPDSLSLEFPDLGYKCCFEVRGGIGQWFYDTIPSSPEEKLSVGTKKCLHSFFHKEMVTGGLEAFYMIEKFLCDQEQLRMPIWVDRTGPCRRYNIRVYLEFEAETHCDWDSNYTEYSVSANNMLGDFFTALCGRNITAYQQNLRRDFTLTQILHKERKMGREYTWGEVIDTGALMKDLGWVCEDAIIWVLPSPCNFLSV